MELRIRMDTSLEWKEIEDLAVSPGRRMRKRHSLVNPSNSSALLKKQISPLLRSQMVNMDLNSGCYPHLCLRSNFWCLTFLQMVGTFINLRESWMIRCLKECSRTKCKNVNWSVISIWIIFHNFVSYEIREYYFSEENLCRDFYLRRKMDSEGYLPIHLIASFQRVQQLTQDFQKVLNAVESSSKLEMKDGCVRTLVDPLRWPIADSAPGSPLTLVAPTTFPLPMPCALWILLIIARIVLAHRLEVHEKRMREVTCHASFWYWNRWQILRNYRLYSEIFLCNYTSIR